MSKKSTAPSWLQEIHSLPKSERKKVRSPADPNIAGRNAIWNEEQKKKTDKSNQKVANRRHKHHGRLKESTNPYLLALAAKAKRTPAELSMEDLLAAHFPGFRAQVVVGRRIADFLHEESRLIIEVDGEYHFFRSAQDATRTRELSKMGFRVVRFTNHEVLEQPQTVIERLTALRGAEYALLSV